MTARKRTTGGPKAEKAKTPRASRSKSAAQKEKDQRIALLYAFMDKAMTGKAPVDAMLAVSIESVRGDIFQARWTEDGIEKTYRGSFLSVYLWIGACIVEGRLLTGITNDALKKLYRARAVYQEQRAA